MAANFVQKTLDTLLEVVEVEFKIPLGFAEIKFPVTAHAKKWWKNKKSRTEVEEAIRRAEESFIAAHPEDKLAQILHDFPLYAEEDYRVVVFELLAHLEEEKITWLAEVKLEHEWDKYVTREEIRHALELYLPFLRHELNGIKEFRDIITARILEGLDKKTDRIDKRTERMENKLDEALKLKAQASSSGKLNTGWFYGHRYGDLTAFTGRAAELKMLDEWLANERDNLLMLNAFGGFGKSALAWTWFNRVHREQWQTAVWWSFYEKESGFESFLSETLKHLGVEVKESARQQVNDLLEAMRGTNILIVLDGFERLLRQYGRMDAALQSDDEDADIDPSQRDCSSPLTETFLRGLSGAGTKSKVLMTTRLCPRVLESADGKLLKGCRDEALSAFSPEDAVTYFHNEGIKARRDEIIAVCSAYGYHPLSLSLLVGLINEDNEKRGDIAAVKNLEIFEDIKARRHHVLERAYESLAPERRDLLSRISCFRGSMEYAVLKKVFPSPDLDKALLDLRKRGLLQYTGESQRYDLHPIVRHYAYDRLTDADRTGVHERLVNYFDAVPKPTKVKTLEDLAAVIELYHHMVRAGKVDEAMELYFYSLWKKIYYQFGAFQLEIELVGYLFSDEHYQTTLLRRDDARGWALNELANDYALIGQPHRAIPLFELYISISEKADDKHNMAMGFGNMAIQQWLVGKFQEATSNIQRQISLFRENNEAFWEAAGHQELGLVSAFCGAWQEADREFDAVNKIKVWKESPQSFGLYWAYRALHTILTTRDTASKSIKNCKSAITQAQRALELANETAKIEYPHPRDFMRAHWLLGAAHRINNDMALAEENLSKALYICRQINEVDLEADILLDLARLRYAQGDFKDAQEKASEALMITERSGYVLQGADVNLFLATLALEGYKLEGLKVLSNKDAAFHHAKEALRLAHCDDGPPYYYKVAYEEAERMLEKL